MDRPYFVARRTDGHAAVVVIEYDEALAVAAEFGAPAVVLNDRGDVVATVEEAATKSVAPRPVRRLDEYRQRRHA